MFGDICRRIDSSYLGDEQDLNRFQRKNDVVFEFVKSNSGEQRRYSRMNFPGVARCNGSKLYFVIDGHHWPPRSEETVYLMGKVNDKLFQCSTPKCYFSSPRSDHIARHIAKCTVSFLCVCVCKKKI